MTPVFFMLVPLPPPTYHFQVPTTDRRVFDHVAMGNTPSSQHKVSAQDRAILDMKTQRDKLHQYQQRITQITSRESAIARECLARDDRPKALLALRRKKFQESLLAKTDAQLATLEQLTSSVEFALVQQDVLFGLRQGTSVLKQIQAEMGGLESVEKLMGESEEARAYQREVGEMLGGRMSNQDEDEVEEELEAMRGEIRGEVEEVEEWRGEEAVEYPAAPASEPAFAGELNEAGQQKAKARARAHERKAALAAEPMLA